MTSGEIGGNDYSSRLNSKPNDNPRLVVLVNQRSTRYEMSKWYIENELEPNYEIQKLETSTDPTENIQKLKLALAPEYPDDPYKILVMATGDGGANMGFNALYAEPEIINTPVICLPFGNGNDTARNLNDISNIDRILAEGRIVKFKPIEIGHKVGEEETTDIAVSYYSIGATGNIGLEINMDQVRRHDYFNHAAVRDLLIVQAGLRGYKKTKRFTMEEHMPDGNVNTTQEAELEFYNGRYFAKYGRINKKLTDDEIRQAAMHRKLSPPTIYKLGCYCLGRAGVPMPSKPMEGDRTFRVTPAEGQTLYSQSDGEVKLIEPGTTITVRRGSHSLRAYSTRQRP